MMHGQKNIKNSVVPDSVKDVVIVGLNAA